MKITDFKNGQIQVKSNNLVLTHTNLNGFKNNDCEVIQKGFSELVSSSDKRFKPLFIALINFKNKI